jgi:beta-phosphoglucomutase-like phosphatase (HAD superfamily)
MRAAMASASPPTSPENVTALLQQGLSGDGESWFEVSSCSNIVPHRKPAPDIYFRVLEKMGLSAADCIALEDSENGLHSGLAAGIKTFVTVNHYTRNQNFTGAAGVFDDLSNLGDFYRKSGLPLPKPQVSV